MLKLPRKLEEFDKLEEYDKLEEFDKLGITGKFVVFNKGPCVCPLSEVSVPSSQTLWHPSL